jgi:hypothetical protein
VAKITHNEALNFIQFLFRLISDQAQFWIADCGLRPGGVIGAYDPEGLRIADLLNRCALSIIIDRIVDLSVIIVLIQKMGCSKNA